MRPPVPVCVRGDAQALVGPNGTGKSTLLKLCTKELEPTEGEVRHNPKLRIGVYSQHSVDQLAMDKTPVQYLMGKFNELDYQARARTESGREREREREREGHRRQRTIHA
jgi:ATPase subunit of ABC transporter with duplicated ATPase domains